MSVTAIQVLISNILQKKKNMPGHSKILPCCEMGEVWQQEGYLTIDNLLQENSLQAQKMNIKKKIHNDI